LNSNGSLYAQRLNRARLTPVGKRKHVLDGVKSDKSAMRPFVNIIWPLVNKYVRLRGLAPHAGPTSTRTAHLQRDV